MEKKKVDKFIKFNSFEHFKDFNSVEKREIIEKLKKLKLVFNTNSEDKKKIVIKAIHELSSENPDQNDFQLKNNTIAELKSLNESDYLEYIYHRYRYEIFPILKKIDNYPPCLQIEPSSICNFRCIFCFETDKTFTNKKNGHMGVMSLDLFKKIIDQSKISYDEIKNLYFFSSQRWDLELKNNIIIKLSKNYTNESLNLALEFLYSDGFRDVTIIDARIKNQIILND